MKILKIILLFILGISFNPFIIAQINKSILPFKNNGRFGYCNSNKEILIPEKYSEAGFFIDDNAIVKQDGQEGFHLINLKGEEIKSFNFPHYGIPRNGIIPVGINYLDRDYNERQRWGAINLNGDTVIPFKYRSYFETYDKEYFNFTTDEEEHVVLYDHESNTTIACDTIIPYSDSTANYTIKLYLLRRNNLYAVYNPLLQGNGLITEFVYKLNYLNQYGNGFELTSAKNETISINKGQPNFILINNDLRGILDINCKMIVPPKYSSIHISEDNSFIYAYNNSIIDFYNFNGTKFHEPIQGVISYADKNILIVHENDSISIYSGKTLLKKSEKYKIRSNGLNPMILQHGKNISVMNLKGEILLAPGNWSDTISFGTWDNNYALLHAGTIYITIHGNIYQIKGKKIELLKDYAYVEALNDSLLLKKKKGAENLGEIYDAKNNRTIDLSSLCDSCYFTDLNETIKEGYLTISNGKYKYGVYDLYNRSHIPPTNDGISLLDNKNRLFKIYKNSKEGVIGKNNTILIPAEFDDIRVEENKIIASRKDRSFHSRYTEKGEFIDSVANYAVNIGRYTYMNDYIRGASFQLNSQGKPYGVPFNKLNFHSPELNKNAEFVVCGESNSLSIYDTTGKIIGGTYVTLEQIDSSGFYKAWTAYGDESVIHFLNYRGKSIYSDSIKYIASIFAKNDLIILGLNKGDKNHFIDTSYYYRSGKIAFNSNGDLLTKKAVDGINSMYSKEGVLLTNSFVSETNYQAINLFNKQLFECGKVEYDIVKLDQYEKNAEHLFKQMTLIPGIWEKTISIKPGLRISPFTQEHRYHNLYFSNYYPYLYIFRYNDTINYIVNFKSNYVIGPVRGATVANNFGYYWTDTTNYLFNCETGKVISSSPIAYSTFDGKNLFMTGGEYIVLTSGLSGKKTEQLKDYETKSFGNKTIVIINSNNSVIVLNEELNPIGKKFNNVICDYSSTVYSKKHQDILLFLTNKKERYSNYYCLKTGKRVFDTNLFGKEIYCSLQDTFIVAQQYLATDSIGNGFILDVTQGKFIELKRKINDYYQIKFNDLSKVKIHLSTYNDDILVDLVSGKIIFDTSFAFTALDSYSGNTSVAKIRTKYKVNKSTHENGQIVYGIKSESRDEHLSSLTLKKGELKLNQDNPIKISDKIEFDPNYKLLKIQLEAKSIEYQVYDILKKDEKIYFHNGGELLSLNLATLKVDTALFNYTIRANKNYIVSRNKDNDSIKFYDLKFNEIKPGKNYYALDGIDQDWGVVRDTSGTLGLYNFNTGKVKPINIKPKIDKSEVQHHVETTTLIHKGNFLFSYRWDFLCSIDTNGKAKEINNFHKTPTSYTSRPKNETELFMNDLFYDNLKEVQKKYNFRYVGNEDESEFKIIKFNGELSKETFKNQHLDDSPFYEYNPDGTQTYRDITYIINSFPLTTKCGNVVLIKQVNYKDNNIDNALNNDKLLDYEGNLIFNPENATINWMEEIGLFEIKEGEKIYFADENGKVIKP